MTLESCIPWDSYLLRSNISAGSRKTRRRTRSAGREFSTGNIPIVIRGRRSTPTLNQCDAAMQVDQLECSWKMRRQSEAGATVYRKSLVAPADVIFHRKISGDSTSSFMRELARKKSSRSHGTRREEGGRGEEKGETRRIVSVTGTKSTHKEGKREREREREK